MSGFQLNPSRAWWLGAVLTDGSFARPKPNMRRVILMVTDRDFAEAFVDACDEMIGTRYAITPRPGSTPRSKPTWLVQATSKPLYEWGMEMTEAKSRMPKCMFDQPREIQRHFLAGVMDGDGWVSIGPQSRVRNDGHRGIRVQIGVASCDPWLYDLKRLADSMGLIARGPRLIKRDNPKWRPIYNLLFAIEPFIAEQVPLRIARKRMRLEHLYNDLKSSEAICLEPGYDPGKRWSELPSDGQSGVGTETARLAPSQ